MIERSIADPGQGLGTLRRRLQEARQGNPLPPW